ncbi:molecular chaperone DnaJ [Colletotrichum truncatum]|uniref:Molecular chaperone DnaJ n=1 Tax=Colletotrichum truncatum TaxID=5467 RepID=A0ACC3YLX1_COLTU|nr:molecular chaperone DnaJ [Colletotrichum truncatum]KAF6791513.1 molecular chaperone DnaJ [Colletotrichum truncatum]
MTALPPDPYRILGVSKDAQLNEIRAAHRKLVLKCHPDKVQDPTLKAAKQDEFQKVQQAYELLSDDNERAKYDDNVKLAELRKEMAAKGMSANTSAPRTPSARTYDVNIRTAEPRADTFKTTPTYRSSPGTKMYSQYPSRSWDEEIHRSSPIFEEPRARRAASYEKPSRQEEDRDRERERRRRKEEDREREREEAIRADRRERERIAIERERIAEKKAADKAAEKAARKAAEKAAEEKEIRRRERKAFEKAEKEREKERKLAAEDKSRRHKTAAAYVEPYGDDETYLAKTDKKKSSSSKKSKDEDKRSRSIPREATREEVPPPPTPAIPVDLTKLKYAETMLSAASYMDKARKGAPGLSRAQTFAEGSRFEPPVAAPTPPAAAPFAPPPPPPPVPTADEDVRRSKSRRSSETKREKSSHKKSPTKDQPSPYVVDASPTARAMPQFASAHSSPVGAGSPPKHLGRSSTFNDGYVRPPPGPARAQTFHYGIETDSRGRNRSRLQPQVSEDSDSEDDPRPPRRSHRHKVEEAIPLDYNQPRSTRYAVSGTRTIPVESGHSSYYRDESPTRKVYYMDRPPIGRESSNYSSSGFGSKVKTSRGYTHEDVQYSNIPHRYRDPEYAY